MRPINYSPLKQSVSVCQKKTAAKTDLNRVDVNNKSQHKVSIIQQFEVEIQLCIEMEQVWSTWWPTKHIPNTPHLKLFAFHFFLHLTILEEVATGGHVFVDSFADCFKCWATNRLLIVAFFILSHCRMWFRCPWQQLHTWINLSSTTMCKCRKWSRCE